jgi:hypothetical protein
MEASSEAERVTARHDRAWVAAVALGRGLAISDEHAEKLAQYVAPILARFAQLSAMLTVDEDMYEFRRVLAQEAERDR